jgi:hypothetical protein
VDSEGDESADAEIRRMVTRMFKELKEDLQKQIHESQENTDKQNQEEAEITKGTQRGFQ